MLLLPPPPPADTAPPALHPPLRIPRTGLLPFRDRAHAHEAGRFFGGLSLEETAAALDVSPRTVQRDWTLAQAWLHRDMSGEGA